MNLCAPHAPVFSLATPLTPLPVLDLDAGLPDFWRDATRQATDAGLRAARFPFDAARANYATAVQGGLIERSMLASRDFERTLNWLETVTLGPWARQV
ncbi:MAG TPA: hypothetical protein PKE61_12570 [Burkholderiaceae bacterium]|nr:hypothetical protein [Burkholderiaceae bacterium]HNB45496.1 hypothetical protein [Burkholderiaceae bacterium]HNG82293.1 hypothetical protein [Burkholderiaceae bacterium]